MSRPQKRQETQGPNKPVDVDPRSKFEGNSIRGQGESQNLGSCGAHGKGGHGDKDRGNKCKGRPMSASTAARGTCSMSFIPRRCTPMT